MENILLNRINNIFTVNRFIDCKNTHYRNHLNVDLDQDEISDINSEYSIKIFNFVKQSINNQITYPISKIKIKENSENESIIYLELDKKFKDFDFINKLLSDYSNNLKFKIIQLYIKTDKIYIIKNLKPLKEIYSGKSFVINIDIFSRNNYYISNQIYNYLNTLLIGSKNLICFGRDVIIPPNLNNNFSNITVISHNNNILESLTGYIKIKTQFKKKEEYYLVLNKLNKDIDITIYISSGRKGLSELFIKELSKFVNINLIVVWCVIDELIRDYQILTDYGFTLKNCNVFNEHPSTNYLTSILNFQK
jgi:hypothetical protein